MSSQIRQVGGNELMLLTHGAAFFSQLCADIDAAQHNVYLETYLYADDESGRMVAAALQRAAGRGLEVRLLLDGFGSAELSPDLIEALREAGVVVRWFRREKGRFALRRRRLYRLHRKLAVMDGKVAFVGGINIINDTPAGREIDAPRLDYAVRVCGPLAAEVQDAMQRLWEMVSWAALRSRIKHEGWHRVRRKMDPAAPVQLVLRDNVRHRRDIERAYLKAIAGAAREVIIANAYFLPGRLFRRALVRAARRGVRVILLLQGRAEYYLQHYATLELYTQLAEAGVEIYEYQPSYLHAKVAVVDGEWATVGSFNIDPFSLFMAREANIVVRDTGFAAMLRGSLMQAIEHEAVRVALEQRGVLIRTVAYVSYALIRFVIGVLGYAKRY